MKLEKIYDSTEFEQLDDERIEKLIEEVLKIKAIEVWTGDTLVRRGEEGIIEVYSLKRYREYQI